MRLKAMAVAGLCAAALAAALTGCSSTGSYTPEQPEPSISSPAIAEDGVLRVGVNASAAPLAGTNKDGDLVGFDVDLAAALADELGLKVETTDVGANGASALQNGTVDIVLGVEADSSTTGVWESDPYLQTAVALFAQGSSTRVPTTDSNPTIAVQTSSTSSWMAENEFGASALVRESSLSDAFSDLSSGKAQYVAADAVRGTYALQSDDAGANASIVALMHEPSGYCAAVSSSNTQLQRAVEQALGTIMDGGMIDVLDKKWLGDEWDLSSVPLTAGATSNTRDASSNSSSDDQASEGDDATDNAGGNALTPEEVAAA